MTYCIYNVTSSTITNNILVHFQWNKQLEGTADGIITEECLLNNTVKNNVFTGDAPNSNNRGGIYATTDIFDCGSTISLWSFYRSDTYLKLVPNSPAAGYATDGGDCGPWSGASPYVVGGITSATEPMTGNYKLDLNATDNPSNGVFQSLLSLFTAMGTNGIGSQMNVSVADGVYNYVINEATYAVLQAMGAQVIASTGAISMAAASSATFNFTVDTSFLLAHSSEISNITAIFNTIKERISLTHITVLFNGTPVIFDEFQVEANDLLALKNMYQAWGGDNWTTKRWNFENNGRNKDDFPGVTFDENGRVTAIDLENNNLVGECFNVYSPQLSELTSLNLSRNKLEGDLGLLVNGMAKMKYLNLSYNRLNCISKDLQFAEEFSSTIDIRYQNRKYLEGSPMKADFTENIDTMPAMKVLLSREMYFTVPSLFTYDFKYQAHRLNPPLCVRQITPPALDFATLTYNGSNYGDNGKSYTLNYSGLYSLPQDQRMVLVDEWSSYVRYSALPVIFHYEVGDADMNGTTNVLDVQYTLNYVLAPSTISYFNYSAANTYTDQQINVQDIVKTVNIILDQPQPDYQFSRRAATVPDVSTSDEGIVSIADCRVIVSTQRDVSAIDIELEGITIDQVGLMLNQRDFQMIGRNTEWGCRFIIFSPTGKHITAGTDTALLRLSAQATVVGIQCSDPYAQKVMMTIGTTPTGIKETTKEKAPDNAIYNLNGHRLTDGDMIKKGIYVRQGQKFIVR